MGAERKIGMREGDYLTCSGDEHGFRNQNVGVQIPASSPIKRMPLGNLLNWTLRMVPHL